MERVVVSGESGEPDNIRFRHRPSWGLPLVADDKIFE
jgi:hypothetical protein